MRKNVFFTGILAMTLVLGMTVISCDKGDNGGGGGITAKFKFTNTGSAPPSLNIVSSVIGGPSLSVTSDTTFAAYTNFYNAAFALGGIGGTDIQSLGGSSKKVGSVTPSSFKLCVLNLRVFSNAEQAGWALIQGANTLVDFAQNVTITPGEVEPDTTFDMVSLEFATSNLGVLGLSMVQFAWPSGATWPNDQMTAAGATKSGNIVTVPLGALLPGTIKNDGSGPSPTQNAPKIVFAGTQRNLLNASDTFELNANEIVSSFPSYNTNVVAMSDVFVVPFTPVTVPSGANAVRVEVRWNLDNIIEQYRGADDTANTADDIFVLKNGWWEALSMAGIIE
jgi:hypothetical protein